MFKRKICYTKMTNLLQITINVHKSHRPPQCTLQLVCEDRVLFVSVDLHVYLCGQQHPYFERTILLVYPPFFCKRPTSSNPTTKNLTELGLEFKHLYLNNQSELDTRPYELLSHND